MQHVSLFRSTLCTSYLCLTSGGDGGGTLLVLDRAAAAATGLDGLDDLVRLDIAIRNAAEDDVLAIEPRGDDSGDEELGAVGVATSVGHGEEALLGVLELEVLVLEAIAVD
jgi:hypothetical protein